jgi:hypothetical protein
MRITYDPNLYNFDDGRYLAKFIGVGPFNNAAASGKDGLPLGPAYKWCFMLVSGPDTDKVSGNITSMHPTVKNACGRMIMAVSDSDLDEEAPFDSDDFVGAFYMVTIRGGKLVDNPGPRFTGGPKACVADMLAAIGAKKGGKNPTPEETEATDTAM